MAGYVAADVLRELVSTLSSRKHARPRHPELQTIDAVPLHDQWPIAVRVTVTSHGWQKPRIFEMSFEIDDFDPEDSGIQPASEVADRLATLFLLLAEEWVAIGPLPGEFKEVKL